MKKLINLRFCFLLVIHGFLIGSMHLQAQQIIIDKPVKAGDLTLFPEMGNENVYYYLPDQLRLATHENGKPQFSFLKYVDNTRSAPGADDIREVEGGGIVHAVVSLSVTSEQLAEAKNALRQINSEGTLKGPVIYNGGTMTIISSFTNTDGELTKQVVGIGRAPLIDGQNAAVSMELTKKGAKILWESFKTPTPDISFSFEMELSGYRSPIKALIEADFEKMYKHKGFQLGATGKYGNVMFGGEIELAFDELRNSGAIKITNMGSDAEMDKLIETAYNKLTSAMFDPIGTGNSVIQGLMKSVTGKKSALERATDLYKQGEKKSATKSSTKSKKTSSLHSYPSIDDVVLWASNDPQMSSAIYHFPYSFTITLQEWEPKHIKEVVKDYIRLFAISDAMKNNAFNKIDANEYVRLKELEIASIAIEANKSTMYYRQYLLSDSEKLKYSKILDGPQNPNEEFSTLIGERVSAIVFKQDFLNEQQKTYILDAAVPDTSKSWDVNLALSYIAWVNRNGIVYVPEKAKYAAMVTKIDALKTTTNGSIGIIAEKQTPTKQDIQNPDDWTFVGMEYLMRQFLLLQLYLPESTRNELLNKVEKQEFIGLQEVRNQNMEIAKEKSMPISSWYDIGIFLTAEEYDKLDKDLSAGKTTVDEVYQKYMKKRVEEIASKYGYSIEPKAYIDDLNALYSQWMIDGSGKDKDSKIADETVRQATQNVIGEKPLTEVSLGTKKNNQDTGSKAKPKDKNKKAAATSGTKKGTNAATKKKSDTKKKDFKMAVMASYQFKKIKQKGTFKINLNKYTADKLMLRFDENIGKINCDECFFEVNLDDPMFKQREIVAILDGFNFDDFGKYINYVNLKMKKRHQNGEVTVDEVRIDRDNFMKSANNFKLMYGWKGDDNRSKWFDYEIQTQWSFFGGYNVSGNWEQVNANIVNLAAPYLRKTIELEADPEMLKEKQVRSVNVKIFYNVGDKEQIEVVSMLPSRDQYSEKVDVMMPNGTFEYDYEISWRLYGNKTQSSGRQTTSESILFVDEL